MGGNIGAQGGQGISGDDPDSNAQDASPSGARRSETERRKQTEPRQSRASKMVFNLGGPLSESLADNVLTWFKKRNGDTLKYALAFVPWVLQQAWYAGAMENGQIVIHTGEGAVVFSDASGFTALTEALAKKPNGAELLSKCLDLFFTPLIDLINAYRGDVIKFSGDALMIYFQAYDDDHSKASKSDVPPHGTYGLPDLGPMSTSVLRASACCIEIHKRLHNFDTHVGDVRLCLHIGLGCGTVSILQVGGIVPPKTHVPRCEYFIAGPPLEQISVAEPLAKNGETCLSPQAWHYVKDAVIEGPRIDERPDYHLLARMDESKYTFPTIKHAAMDFDNRKGTRFQLSELNVIRRYIPSTVFKQIQGDTLTYVNEMRNISAMFVSAKGLDVMQDHGACQTQELMVSVQRTCYAHEGTLNKFLIDDKGMLFLLVWGLPPLVHRDDPTRALLAAFDMLKVFLDLKLVGKFGVTTGRSYCGLCGSSQRMEYTVLGDCVNTSARLMASSVNEGVLCDKTTKTLATAEIVFENLEPLKLKGKKNATPVFRPSPAGTPACIGLTSDRNIFFPWYAHPLGELSSNDSDITQRQRNVQQLCGVKSWAGIRKVDRLLGAAFGGKNVASNQVIPRTGAPERAPAASPFDKGGVILLESSSGMGNIELAEHIVSHAALNFRMMPVFGTMGMRPRDSIRLSVELVKSTLAAFRHLSSNVAADDNAALKQVVPPNHSGQLPLLREILQDNLPKPGEDTQTLHTILNIVVVLLQLLRRQTAINIVLQLEYGTSQTRDTNVQEVFWNDPGVVSTLLSLVEDGLDSSDQGKPVVMTILCKDALRSHAAVKIAEGSDSLVQLAGLTPENIQEYISNYTGVPQKELPEALVQFVTKLTQGNPLFIRETICQLLDSKHIQINTERYPRTLECKDLTLIDISAWDHTAMVGGTVCLLESLDPLESAVLKMSTCFTGAFTLPDLAASTCSPWADATYFDNMRLFHAIWNLVQQNIIETVPAPDDAGINPVENRFGETQYFRTNNVLIRAVGNAMVLEMQKKSVKRQALVDRVLSRDLPERMDQLGETQNQQHIPWYYEEAFRRMAEQQKNGDVRKNDPPPVAPGGRSKEMT